MAAAAPSVWTLSSATRREMPSTPLHHETKRDSPSPSSVRTALLASLLHQQPSSVQVPKRERKRAAAATTLMSTHRSDEAATSADGFANAKTTPVSSFTETAVVAAAATQAAAAIPTYRTSALASAAQKSTAAGLTAEVHALLTAAAAAPLSAQAAIRTGPASPSSTGAPAEPASMRTMLLSVATEAPEVSKFRTTEAALSEIPTPSNPAAASGAPSHFTEEEEEEALLTAVELHPQPAAGQPSGEESNATSTDPDDETASLSAGGKETDTATQVASETFSAASAGAEEVHVLGGRNRMNTGRSEGKFSFVSTIENDSSSFSAALGKPVGKQSTNAGSMQESPITPPTVYLAAARDYREAAATDAERTREHQQGNTAAKRAAALAPKRLLEKETQAARNAASEPTAAAKGAAEGEAESKKDARGRGDSSSDTSQTTDRCAAVLEPMVQKGVSAGAAEKIKVVLEVERFLDKVHDLRRIAARRCLAGEKDACETPDNPVWETAGLSKPPEAPSIQPFRLPAELCDVPAGNSSRPQGTEKKKASLGSRGAAGTRSYSAPEMEGQADGNTEKYTMVREAQSTIKTSAAGAAASFLRAANEAIADRDRASEMTVWSKGRTGSQSNSSSRSQTFARGDNESERSSRIDRWNSSEQIGSSSSRSGDTRGSNSERESSYRDSNSGSIHSSRLRVFGKLRKSNMDSLQEKNMWQMVQDYAGGQDNKNAVAEANSWNEADAIDHAGRRQRISYRQTRRTPLHLTMQADDSSPPVRSSVFMQMRSRGVFDMLSSLFGNGMDISNPQNFDGGNQGSFFNFMFPADTDYPWACVCDEHQWKQWENKEIDAVPCRNQVDTSSQGITAACNPLNHNMNEASPSNGHLSAIVIGSLLSVATAFFF